MGVMDSKTVFNAVVCLIGSLILLVHIANVLFKKKRRKDENLLLVFLGFTAFHFACYFVFCFLKTYWPSDALILGFYTGFFLANNAQVFLLFLYMLCYVEVPDKAARAFYIGNLALFAIFVVLDFVNLGTHMFFTAQNGAYVRAGGIVFSQGYQFAAFSAIFLIVLWDKKLTVRQKVAFSVYCLLPLVAIVLQNLLPGYAIAYLSIIVAIEVLFVFLNVEKNLELAKEEEKLKDVQVRMMLSQIRPHFVYNSLSSISTLIPLDPENAQKALDAFTEYLRANFSSLTENRLISFEDELRHTEAFLSLEELRFGERLKVVLDIQASGFFLPPLSIQPLVENAVRHGILKKVEGGTVILRSYEEEDAYVIEVEDDGVGFDVDSLESSSNKHIGIHNIAYRLSKMGKGTLSIESVPDKGTKATVRILK